jgi:hypothetical protein
MLNSKLRIKAATHAGSRIVTYLPGGRGLGLTERYALSMAVAEQRA